MVIVNDVMDKRLCTLNSAINGLGRAECAVFAHSADIVIVGVSLRKVIIIPVSNGSLIPTYKPATNFNRGHER